MQNRSRPRSSRSSKPSHGFQVFLFVLVGALLLLLVLLQAKLGSLVQSLDLQPLSGLGLGLGLGLGRRLGLGFNEKPQPFKGRFEAGKARDEGEKKKETEDLGTDEDDEKVEENDLDLETANQDDIENTDDEIENLNDDGDEMLDDMDQEGDLEKKRGGGLSGFLEDMEDLESEPDSASESDAESANNRTESAEEEMAKLGDQEKADAEIQTSLEGIKVEKVDGELRMNSKGEKTEKIVGEVRTSLKGEMAELGDREKANGELRTSLKGERAELSDREKADGELRTSLKGENAEKVGDLQMSSKGEMDELVDREKANGELGTSLKGGEKAEKVDGELQTSPKEEKTKKVDEEVRTSLKGEMAKLGDQEKADGELQTSLKGEMAKKTDVELQMSSKGEMAELGDREKSDGELRTSLKGERVELGDQEKVNGELQKSLRLDQRQEQHTNLRGGHRSGKESQIPRRSISAANETRLQDPGLIIALKATSNDTLTRMDRPSLLESAQDTANSDNALLLNPDEGHLGREKTGGLIFHPLNQSLSREEILQEHRAPQKDALLVDNPSVLQSSHVKAINNEKGRAYFTGKVVMPDKSLASIDKPSLLESSHVNASKDEKGRAHLTGKDGMSDKALANKPRNKKRHKKARETIHTKKRKQPEIDTRIWGYFPGLDSRLSFSKFLEGFLNASVCSSNVFMAWTTPPWSFTLRYQRSLESLLYFHPRACVVFFSETLELDFFSSFVNDGYRVAVAMPNLEELLENTPADVFASIWLSWRKIDLYFIHYTELLRLAALYKYGGIYLDTDVIVMKPLDGLQNVIGAVSTESGEHVVNGGVMVFNKSSAFLMDCLTEFTATYNDKLYEWNGAQLLQRVVNNSASRRGENWWKNEQDLRIDESPLSFFPLSPHNITRYFAVPGSKYEQQKQDALFQLIITRSYTFHLWNHITRWILPEAQSLVHKILNYHCLRCDEIL